VLGGLILLVAALSFLSLKIDPQVLVDEMMASAPGPFREQMQQGNPRLVVRVEAIVVGTIATFMGLSLLLSAAPIRRG
jgi:hypothetical protein